MADNGDKLPLFWGESGEKYRSWKASILWNAAACTDDKQRLFAPKVIARCLRGDPQEYFRDQDIEVFRHANGIERLFEILDSKYGTFAEVELSSVVRSFFYRQRRSPGEAAASFEDSSSSHGTACDD